jgi:hypothetical protein
VESYSDNIIAASKYHNGQLIVMAVNKKNEPARAVIKISDINNLKARVIFENRSVSIINGVLDDEMASLGSQVYLIDLKPEKKETNTSYTNLLRDPGFEDMSSPGIPSACYARPGGDRGATYFLDTRDPFEGNHSLRLVTPENDKSMAIRFFPFYVKAGASYTISLWSMSDPEQRFSVLPENNNTRLNQKEEMPQYVEVLLGEFGRARFIPDKEWRRFVTFVTIPNDTLPQFKTNLILKMPGQGVAWFDKIKVFEEK